MNSDEVVVSVKRDGVELGDEEYLEAGDIIIYNESSEYKIIVTDTTTELSSASEKIGIANDIKTIYISNNTLKEEIALNVTSEVNVVTGSAITFDNISNPVDQEADYVVAKLPVKDKIYEVKYNLVIDEPSFDIKVKSFLARDYDNNRLLFDSNEHVTDLIDSIESSNNVRKISLVDSWGNTVEGMMFIEEEMFLRIYTDHTYFDYEIFVTSEHPKLAVGEDDIHIRGNTMTFLEGTSGYEIQDSLNLMEGKMKVVTYDENTDAEEVSLDTTMNNDNYIIIIDEIYCGYQWDVFYRVDTKTYEETLYITDANSKYIYDISDDMKRILLLPGATVNEFKNEETIFFNKEIILLEIVDELGNVIDKEEEQILDTNRLRLVADEHEVYYDFSVFDKENIVVKPDSALDVLIDGDDLYLPYGTTADMFLSQLDPSISDIWVFFLSGDELIGNDQFFLYEQIIDGVEWTIDRLINLTLDFSEVALINEFDEKRIKITEGTSGEELIAALGMLDEVEEVKIEHEETNEEIEYSKTFEKSDTYDYDVSIGVESVSGSLRYNIVVEENIVPEITWMDSNICYALLEDRILLEAGTTIGDLFEEDTIDYRHEWDDNFSYEHYEVKILNDSNEEVKENATQEIPTTGYKLKIIADGLEKIYDLYTTNEVGGVTSTSSNLAIDNNYQIINLLLGEDVEFLINNIEEVSSIDDVLITHYGEAGVENLEAGMVENHTELVIKEVIGGMEWPIEYDIDLSYIVDTSLDSVIDSNLKGVVVKDNITVGKLIADIKSLNDNYINNVFVENHKREKKSDEAMIDPDNNRICLETDYGNIRLNIFEGYIDYGLSTDEVINDGKIKNVEIRSSDDQALVKGYNDGYIYLKAQETLELKLIAKDKDGESVDLSDSSIDLYFEDSHGDPLEYNIDGDKISITTKGVQGGYGDEYLGMLKVDDYVLDLKVSTYKGAIGVFEVQTPSGEKYPDESIGYKIGYNFKDQAGNSFGDGSSSGSDVIDGELIIPVRSDYVEMSYAYIVGLPKKSKYANSEVVFFEKDLDLNKKVIKIEEPIVVQEPVFTGTLKLPDGSDWEGCIVDFDVEYLGSLDLYSIGFGMFLEENTFNLAPLGEDFSSLYEMEVKSFNNEGAPLKSSLNIDDTSGVFFSPSVQLSGELLTPDGDRIPTGSGRDAKIKINLLSEERYEVFDSGYTDNGFYEISGLVDGEVYEAYVHLDLGDFDDQRLTDGLGYRFTYVESSDVLEVYNPYTGENEIMAKDNMNFKATYAQLAGNLYRGDILYDDYLEISIYDSNNNFIVSDVTHSSEHISEDNYGVYMLGSVQDLSGEYTLEVEAPKNTIEYTGFTKKLKLPLNSEEKYDYDLHLVKTKVSGKIVGKESLGNVRRVYVNIFDEYGNYIKNGRVRSDGVFAVGNLEEGRYYAKAFVSPYSELSYRYMTSEKVAFEVPKDGKVDFELPLKEKMEIITIKNNEGNTWVRIFDQRMNEVEAIQTKYNGELKIPALEDGTYYFKAYGKEKLDSVLVRGVVSKKELTLEEELALEETYNLKVTLADNQEGEVIVFDEHKNFLSFNTTENGIAKFGGLSNGKHFVKVNPLNSNLVETPFIEVEINEVLEKTIEINAAELVGQVSNSESGWVYLLRNGKVISTHKVEKNEFKLSGIVEGEEYSIYATGKEGFPSEIKKITKASENILLNLRSVPSIKGKITEENIKVYLYDEAQKSVASTKTNMFGEFFFMDIEDGTYNLVVEDEDGPDYLKIINVEGTTDLGQLTIN